LRERSAEKRGGLRGLLDGWRSRPTRLARRVTSVVTEARLSALHCGDFSPGAVLPGADGRASPPRSRQLSPPFVSSTSIHQKQPPIVGPDGDPRPPGAAVTSRSSRRRTRLPPRNVSR